MNKRVNILSSSLLPAVSCQGFTQQTGTVLSNRQNGGSTFIKNRLYETKSTNIYYIKGTTTKKLNPNKDLSHTIQFTSLVQSRFKVYCNNNVLNDFDIRQTGCWNKAIRC